LDLGALRGRRLRQTDCPTTAWLNASAPSNGHPTIDSPADGPTSVTVELPSHA
jgi:hypothetical protein